MNEYNVPQALLDRLKRVGTGTVVTALEIKGYMEIFMEGVRSLTPGKRLAARARTLRFLPSRPDLYDEVNQGEGSPIYKAMALCGPGDALVVDAMGLSYASIGGDVSFLQLKMNLAEGIVTDGGIRDISAIAEYGLVVYAANPTSKIRANDLLFYDWGLPIQCGGVLVRPGDVVMGDESGVVVVPAPLVEETVSFAEEREEIEEFVKGMIEKEGCNPGRYYPVNEEVMRLFQAVKKRGPL